VLTPGLPAEVPDPTALHLGLQRHNLNGPQDVSFPAVVGLRLDGEAGSLPDD